MMDNLMQDNLDMDELHNLSSERFPEPDRRYDFDADSGIFDMDFNDINADPGKFLDPSLCLYPNPEYAFDNNPFPKDTIYDISQATSNLTTSDLQILQVYEGLNIPFAQLPETFQLSSVVPQLAKPQENTLVSSPHSAATGSSHQEQSRRDSEYSIRSDASHTSSNSSANGGDRRATNGVSEESTVKPRKKRGRKRANISETERRSRKLERGRVAAKKCRQKKRLRENDLESNALQLLVERDEMLKLNHDLRYEIIGLQNEALRHVSANCGGFPDAEQVRLSMTERPETSEEAERRKMADFKNLLGSRTHRFEDITAHADFSQQ